VIEGIKIDPLLLKLDENTEFSQRKEANRKEHI